MQKTVLETLIFCRNHEVCAIFSLIIPLLAYLSILSVCFVLKEELSKTFNV